MKQIFSKKLLIIVFAAVLLVAVLIYSTKSRGGSFDNGANTDINYSPPTDDERRLANSQKTQNVMRQESENNQRNNREDTNKVADVVITYAEEQNNIIEVNAFSNKYEDGTCTILFSQGSSKITKQTPAFRDASTTICTNPLIKRSDFPSGGEWDLQVIYNSPSFSGQSELQKITLS